MSRDSSITIGCDWPDGCEARIEGQFGRSVIEQAEREGWALDDPMEGQFGDLCHEHAWHPAGLD